MFRTISRREFLAGAAALAAGSTLRAQTTTTQPAAAEGFGNFTVAIQSYTFRRFNLEQSLQRINELGVRNVELFRGHLATTATDAQIDAAKNLMRQHNVTPVAFGVERFTNDDAANRRLFEFGRKLGIRTFSADPEPNAFDSLDRLVEEFNINIAIHPHGPVGRDMLHRWYSAEVILDAVRNHNRRIGTCLDTGHLIRSAQPPHNRRLDPAQQIRVMGARNFGLHLKDHNNERRTDVVFGRDGGVLNVPEILRALREVRFNGYIAIEYEANENNPTPDVRACLEVFRDAVRRLG
jgi:sugar phosphate isomerase/epimerase